MQRLRMRDPLIQISGFDRPNLWFGVQRFHDADAKEEALAERVAALDKPGIVYTATRKDAERLAEALGDADDDVGAVAAYHGGMRVRERDAVQAAFMDDELDVIVATTAFGMGVDKPNVRFVVHHVVPDSVDSYWQEVDRAGRDGEPATALLLYRPEDLGVRRFFGASGQVDAPEIEAVARAVDDADGPADPTTLQEETDLSQSKVMTAVGRLEDVGAVEVRTDGRVAPTGALGPDAVVQAARIQYDREQFDRSRVDNGAQLRRAARRLPARVPALLLRRVDRRPVRPLRPVRRRRGPGGDRPAVSGRQSRDSSQVGRGDRPALRGGQARRAVRRGRLQGARSRRRARARSAQAGLILRRARRRQPRPVAPAGRRASPAGDPWPSQLR